MLYTHAVSISNAPSWRFQEQAYGSMVTQPGVEHRACLRRMIDIDEVFLKRSSFQAAAGHVQRASSIANSGLHGLI